MAVLTVGAGKQYATIAAAVAASHDGDTVQVNAGTYTNDFVTVNTKISIVGVGGMVNLVSTSSGIPNGKGIMVVNNDLTIDHLSFSGAKVASGNGAGIRYQAGNLTIKNSYFHDNQDGILANASPTGTITIDHSEFAHNGSGDGYTHNIYIGEIASFTLTNSYMHDAVVGHEVKSRAHSNTIKNNVIADGANGTASYDIDLPNGGVGVISGNFIEKGAHASNSPLIHFGGEGTPYAGSSLLVQNNTLISDKAGAYSLFNATSYTAKMDGNKLWGFTKAPYGPVTETNDTVLSSEPAIPTGHPWETTTTTPAPAPAPAPAPVDSHVLTVGTGKMYSTIKAAVAASHDGDTIKVDAGTYVNDYAVVDTKISIVGVGGMAKLVSSGNIANGKGILVINDDVTIDHLSFTGAKVADGNGAAIRYQAGNLTVKNSYFADNQDGILANSNKAGSITVDHSEFNHNGSGTGYTHGLYIGEVGNFTLTNSYVHDTVVGNQVKSRADHNTIQGNTIADGRTGNSSYAVDLPNGGIDLVANNLIEKGPNASNPTLIHFGGEGTPYAGSSLKVSNNALLADKAGAYPVYNQTAITGTMDGNSLYGFTKAPAGPMTVTNTTVLTTEPAWSTAHPYETAGTTGWHWG